MVRQGKKGEGVDRDNTWVPVGEEGGVEKVPGRCVVLGDANLAQRS